MGIRPFGQHNRGESYPNKRASSAPQQRLHHNPRNALHLLPPEYAEDAGLVLSASSLVAHALGL